jgi:hypothetical protein
MNANRSNQAQLPVSDDRFRELALSNALREASLRLQQQPAPAPPPPPHPTMDIHRQLQYAAAFNKQQQARTDFNSSSLNSSLLQQLLLQQQNQATSPQPSIFSERAKRRSSWPPVEAEMLKGTSPKRSRKSLTRRASTCAEFPLPAFKKAPTQEDNNGTEKDNKDKGLSQFSSFRQLWSGIEAKPDCNDKMKEELFRRQLQSGKLVTGGTSRSALQSAKANEEVRTKRRYILRK